MEEEKRIIRRIYSEKWKAANYEYYRNQKNALGRRDSYKARRRLKYGVARDRLRDSADYVPPTRGRPRLYSPREALQRKRGSARSWARARRADQKISGKDKSQQDDDSGTTPSEKSH